MVEEVFNKCLTEIEEACLALGGRALKEYGLPQLTVLLALENREYIRETNYDVLDLESIGNYNILII